MAQQLHITQRATHTESTGTNWNDVSRAYDDDENSYAERLVGGNSACHINGYSFDLPSNATVDKVVVEFKAYTLSSYGYFAGYLYTDTGSSIAYSIFLDGKAHTSPSYFSLEVPASKIQEKLNSLNVYNKNILTYLKSGVRVRWVGGSTSSWVATTCRVYDTRVTVYYTIPDMYYLDLNGWIDGASSDGISPAGTADVYINGVLAANGDSCTDYYAQHVQGTTYEIKDIKANTGWKYDGVHSGSLSGTINGTTSVVLAFSKIKHTVSLSAGMGGSVTGGGTYDYGSSVTIEAIPNAGYHFARWSDGNTNAERTLTVTANVSLTAYFEADKINKVFSGSTNTSVYIGSTEAGSVSVGNTKIYG